MPIFYEDLKKILLNITSKIDKWFYIHMIINFIINSLIILFLDQSSIFNIIEDNYYKGINLFIIISIVECISSLHILYFIEPHKTIFRAISHKIVERYSLKQLELVSHNSQKILLDNDFLTKKNAIKWNLIDLIELLVDNLFQFVSFLGYIIWISFKSPLTIFIYSITIFLYIKYVKTDFVEWSSYNKNWIKYGNIMNNQYSDLIHGKANNSHNKMAELMYNHEIIRGKDRIFNKKYTENINIIFNIITVFNSLIILHNINDKTLIVFYIQYIRLFRNNLRIFTQIMQQWKTTEKEYKNYYEFFKNSIPMGDMSFQIPFEKNIIIKQGSKFYRENKNSNLEKKLILDVKNTITLNKGSIVYVAGLSGAGKTTLFDIISGVIKHSQTNFNIMIDNIDVSNLDGFEHIKSIRTYLASDIIINISNISIFEIITMNDVNDNDVSVNILNLWNAIQISESTDFVNTDNLYSTEISFSKGQINRLKVARYIYDILNYKPSMVLLDEIADGVDPETTIKIATNIFTYFKKNNILCLVATHLPYLQKLNYDIRINIECGVITI